MCTFPDPSAVEQAVAVFQQSLAAAQTSSPHHLGQINR